MAGKWMASLINLRFLNIIHYYHYMKNLLFLFLTSFTTIPILAQNAENIRVIPSLTDWIEEINTWPDSVYEVENIKVLIDMDKDSLIAHYHVERLNLTSENEEIAAVVKKPIRINHWFIQTDFGTNDLKTIKNIRFKEEVELRDKQSYGIGLDNVIFEKELMFNGQERFSWFNFKNCQFNQNVTFANFNDFAQITFEDCELEEALYTFQIPGAPILRILNTKIKQTIGLGSAELKRLWINKSEINTILLENAEINTALYIVDSDIKNIEIEGASLPAFNTYIPFDQVKGKLCISTWANSEYEYYRAEKDKDFDAQDKYDYLIASYKLLLNGYQNRGDQDSYNSCYVEMKNIETRRLAYLHRKNPSFTSYFSWKINQFLKVFSEYGTKPARAIVFSLYVILFFTALSLLILRH